MNIFYLKKDEFLKTINLSELEKYSDNRKYNSQEKYIEHLLGLYLTKTIAQKFYHLENTDIETINSKPFFKNNNKLYCSISHSKNIILVAFDNKNIGVDVQFARNLNFEQILKRYNSNLEPTKDNFYKFWTKLEAGIKLGEPTFASFSTIIENEYYLSCASAQPIVYDFEIIKIK